MFIAKNNDLIILAKETREELEQALQFMVYTSIEETKKEYELYNGQYLTSSQIAESRKKEFLNDFFKVPNALNNQDLYYRKSPKGYSSAVESINTAFNIVSTIGSLPANSLIFYEEPDFTVEEQCTEEWLVEHQVKNEKLSAEEFGKFYAAFITAWNTKEHED